MSDNINHIEAIYNLLSNNDSIVNLVGTNIFPNVVPQKNGYPAIVYSQLSENYLETKDALINDGYRFTLEIYALADDPVGGYPKAKEIARITKNLLAYYNGQTNGFTYKIRANDELDAEFDNIINAFKIIQDYKLKIV